MIGKFKELWHRPAKYDAFLVVVTSVGLTVIWQLAGPYRYIFAVIAIPVFYFVAFVLINKRDLDSEQLVANINAAKVELTHLEEQSRALLIFVV